MKIIQFSSGLGNQIFYYLFYLYLKDKCQNEKIFGYYLKKDLQNHNGLEIDKVFNVELPQSTIYSNFVAWLCRFLHKLGIHGLLEDRDPCHENAILYKAYYQDKRYFIGNENKIQFKSFELDKDNKNALDMIINSESVSVHVRRGDYLNKENIGLYGGIATEDYYRKSVKAIKSLVKNPTFFVFSNDIQWCLNNLKIENAHYITHNTSEKSFLDMYLMSYCKYNIIANSSFSYWAAMLNKHKEKCVFYPKKWNNKMTPDIFPDNWIGL